MSSSLVHLPYIGFLTAYPHPAFIVPAKRRFGHAEPDINPVLGNPSFRALLLGPDADNSELGLAFLRSLQTAENADRFAQWLHAGRNDPTLRAKTLLIDLKPLWLALDAQPVKLDLSQTVLDDYVVCTSVPRTPIPKFTPVPSPAPTNVPTSTTRGRGDRGMRLPDFPPPAIQLHPNPAAMAADSSSALMRTPTASGQSSYSPERRLEFTGPAQTQRDGMREMIENYDWHSTPLGPRSQWSTVLKASIKYMLAHPFPVSSYAMYF